jgi:hypothetical protein
MEAEILLKSGEAEFKRLECTAGFEPINGQDMFAPNNYYLYGLTKKYR